MPSVPPKSENEAQNTLRSGEDHPPFDTFHREILHYPRREITFFKTTKLLIRTPGICCMESSPPDAIATTGFSRDIAVDILRGLAIALMIMANLSMALFLPPAPGWYRFLCTLAAPLFIVLAGMMIALSRTGKGRSFQYVAVRGGLVMLCGALLHIFAYEFIPFIDMDVLYLIGISLPVAYLYLGIPERKRWIIIPAILLITPVLWVVFGYNDSIIVPEFWLFNPLISTHIPTLVDIVKSWFIDGWFPIFPWIAVSLFGAEIGVYRWRKGDVRTFRFGKEGLYSMGLLIAGGILWGLFPGAQVLRQGYVELSYPPVTGMLVFCAGFFLFALTALDHLLAQYSLMDPLRAMGECSLAIYLIHYTIILRIIEPLHVQLPLVEYFGVFLILLVSMILVAYLLRHIRKSLYHPPFLVRFLIGG